MFSSGDPLGPTNTKLRGLKYLTGHVVLKNMTVVLLVTTGTCCIFETGWAVWNFELPGSL